MKHFLIAAIAAALVISACDDSSGSEDSPSVDSGFVVNSTPAGALTPSILDGELDGSAAPETRDLLALFDAGLLVTYTASYRTASTDGEEGDAYIVFNMPPLSRVDTMPAGSRDESSMVIQKAAGAAANCVPEGADWACDEVEALGSSALTWAGAVVYPGISDLEGATVTDAGGREVAGQTAQCFNITTSEDAGALTYCLNTEGVVLYSSGDFGVVEADSYSTDVSEDDFLLP